MQNSIFNDSIKVKYKFLILVFLILIQTKMFAQQPGSISGKITDKNNNEELIGSNVLILGTTLGASSDIDGNYFIKGLTPGKYNVKVSFISYNSVTVENVIVEEGKSTRLDVALESSATELQEVIVTAEAMKNTEANVLKIQKNSSSIVDGVSSELIKKNNSSDGADILKRMTGVTISEGKYAFIRGVGDRYNNTMLNGANLPSTDPEKKSFSYDIFPASLVENILTFKTFTPDKPADFSGGLVQISTIEFPSRFIFDLSTSGGFNSNTTGKTSIGYGGGKTDFLGYDDGTRGLPGSITSTKLARGNYSDSAITQITKSFSNDWQTKSKTTPMNGSIILDIGNRIEFGEDVFGYVASLTYSNTNATKDLAKNFYDFSGSRYDYTGFSYNNTVAWGGLLNFSYKFDRTNKVSFKNIYNQNADDITTLYKGDYRYADQYREITTFNYVSRSLLSNQLIGQHQISSIFSGLNLEWNVSYSQSKRNEPDSRRYLYSRSIEDPSEPLRFQLDQSLATRYYGDLKDHNFSGDIDLNFQLFENPDLPKLKVGYLFDKKDRDFSARTFGFRNVPGGNFAYEDSVLQGSVEQIFSPENITNKFVQAIEITKPSDSYTSEQKLNSAYAMFDATILQKLKLVAGVRLENSNQKLTSINLQGDSINVDNTYNDLLPGLNLTYALNDWINIRAAYSVTLARPEFRELAPFSYFNFIDNELIQGNPDLKRTLINNYDLRFEMYPGAGELIALSFFYKRFRNPIEEVLQAAANEPIRSFENAVVANNYGIELELRKTLEFISPTLRYFSFIGNGSLITSKVELQNTGFQAGDRSLQGQAPYIFNLGLYYDNYDLGLSSSFVYNKVGQRIVIVGSKDLGNILERPADLIDFSISKTIIDNFSIKFTVRDLLNQERTLIQQSPLGDKVSELEKSGRLVVIGLAYKL
jgi:TonB-dependent receptor